MKRRTNINVGKLAGALCLACFLASPAIAQDHPMHGVALVIGETKYEQLPVLTNPAKDAKDIDRLLGDLGFDVTRVLNADGDRLREAISEFEDDAKDADVALIYYSGHGIEAKGANFIAPTDTDLSSPQSAGESMVAVQPILDELAKTTPVSIVLLDACRSDPFPAGQMIVLPGDTTPTPVEGQGLAPVPVRGPTPVALKTGKPDDFGAVIGFSASPGEPALDGAPGENSPYAAALLKHFAAGGYSFGDVMTMVSEEVYLKTKAKQLPWTNSSLRRVLTFAAPAEDDGGDADQTAIKTERRKLLLTIATTPEQTQKYVESLAHQEDVPLDALYGMLDALGIKATDNGGDLEKQLQGGAARLKDLLAQKDSSVKSDPELERLSKLADDAEAEGAIALALKYRNDASARADTLLKGKQDEAAKLRQDMTDIAATYAANAATALLNFDHVQAGTLYGKAYDAVKDWDKSKAFTYRVAQGDALLDQGYYTTDNEALRNAMAVYIDAAGLVDKTADPVDWSKAQDRIGQAQQSLGERLADIPSLEASIASYEAALSVRTREAMPDDWATSQNNLANAYYSLGHRNVDLAMLGRAVAAFDAALTVLTPDGAPVKWATVQSNRAVAQVDLATFTYASSDSAEMAAAANGNADPRNIPEVVKSKADANVFLGDAIDRLTAALKVLDKSANPLDWGMLEHGLASALEQRGEMNHSVDDLKLAVADYNAVLEIHTKEKTPALWSQTANNLAITLRHLSRETNDAAPVRQAVDLYKQVVAATVRESQPRDWADYQENLGNALTGLADFEDTLPNLVAAEAAFRAAGTETTLESRGPDKWEGLQNALSTTILSQALHSFDRVKLAEAKAIATNTRDTLAAAGHPDDAFFSQYMPLFDKVEAMLPK